MEILTIMRMPQIGLYCFAGTILATKSISARCCRTPTFGRIVAVGRVCIDKSWLMTHGEGLIALSAGMDGEIGKALLARNQKRLLRSVDDYKSIFGDRFYLELSRIGHAREDEYIDATMALAVETGVPVVATNPVQFVHEADFDAHEVRVCINDSRVLNDSRRPKRFSPQQYLRSPEEMAVLFADIPEAIVNSVEIAKRCNATLDFSTTHLPEYPVSDSMDVDQRLRGDALVGLCAQRNENENEIPSEYTARLLQELEVIIGMGFSGYFLIVADFIKWSRNNHIPVGPRTWFGCRVPGGLCVGYHPIRSHRTRFTV